MAQIRLKRGTRAQLDAAAVADALVASEPYWVTDEARVAVGAAAGAYELMARHADVLALKAAHDAGTLGAKVRIDLANGALQTATLGANLLMFLPKVAAGVTEHLTLLIANDATAGRSIDILCPPADETVLESGSITAKYSTIFEDDTKAWADDEWVGHALRMTSGAAAGVVWKVLDSTDKLIVPLFVGAEISSAAIGDTYDILGPMESVRWITGTAPEFDDAANATNIIVLRGTAAGWIGDGGSY